MDFLESILHLFIVGVGSYTRHGVICKLEDNS